LVYFLVSDWLFVKNHLLFSLYPFLLRLIVAVDYGGVQRKTKNSMRSETTIHLSLPMVSFHVSDLVTNHDKTNITNFKSTRKRQRTRRGVINGTCSMTELWSTFTPHKTLDVNLQWYLKEHKEMHRMFMYIH